MVGTLIRVLLRVHGAVHVLGFAAPLGHFPGAFHEPIGRPLGLAWLAVAGACGATSLWLARSPMRRAPWWLAGFAVLASQWLILSAFADAKYGTLPNVLLALGLLAGYRSDGPAGFRAQFERDAAQLRAEPANTSGAPGEATLAQLPPPVQRYLQVTGAAAQPRPRRYALRFRGRIRGGPSEPWMPFKAEQVSRVSPPTRLFLMEATMFGLPVQAYHRYTPEGARFRVRLLGLFELVDARGPELTRAETVTVLNDMCLLAPGSLVDDALRWEPIDARHARVRFRAAQNEVSAELTFDDAGELVDFVSDDRLRASREGKAFTRQRFSTPVRDYRAYGPLRLMGVGEARWHAAAPEGAFSYGEFDLLEARFE